MFQVLHPLGLLALGALAAPILIHLRHRPRPRVRVGSLRPFRAHPTRLPSRTIHQWPLLLVRCALLTALALALAGLRWQPDTSRPARWCLLIPGTLLNEDQLQEWNRLLDEGFEPRWLAPDFPRISELSRNPHEVARLALRGGLSPLAARAELPPAPIPAPTVRRPPSRESVNPSNDSPPFPFDLTADVWSLLTRADRQLPPGSVAHAFGPTWRGWFQGVRPTLHHLHVPWHDVPTTLPSPPLPSPPRVALVHSPDRDRDAQYLRAALQALGCPVVTHEPPDWIFLLGTNSLPPVLTAAHQQGAFLVRDAPEASKPQSVSRTLEVDAKPIQLRQRVAPGPGTPRFRDSHGVPWLNEERQGAAVTWHVAFRFHPDWTDWPLESAFPAWWRDQLQPLPFDPTPIAPEQAAPRFEPPSSTLVSPTLRPPAIDLRAECWMLGVALFLIERALSRSLAARQSRGAPLQPRPA